MKTAIILFIYSRPQHTLEVLKGLKENKIDKLYVFGDGIKEESHRSDVMKTRNIIDHIDWCDVVKEYSDTNKGLANSIIYGVTKIFNMGYDRVIVIEDDCVPKYDFIEFMLNSFDEYENDDKVMHISGFGLPLKQKITNINYFTPYPCSWGWGTWKKYWLDCNFDDLEGYNNLLKNKIAVKKFNESGSAFSEFLDMQLNGKVNSWLIRWYYHIHINNGICVWKKNSSINNSGFDGTGVHKVKFDRFNQKKEKEDSVMTFERNLEPSKRIIREFRRYFINKSLSERVKTVIYMYLGIY